MPYVDKIKKFFYNINVIKENKDVCNLSEDNQSCQLPQPMH